MVRIGELSRELERAPANAGPGRGKKGEKKPLPTNGKSFKADALRSAGISASAAYRAERIADQAPVVEAYIAKKAADAGMDGIFPEIGAGRVER